MDSKGLTLPSVGKPNFLPHPIKVAPIKNVSNFCLVDDKHAFKCKSRVEKKKEDVWSVHEFELMRASCKNMNSPECTFSGPGRHPLGKITYIEKLPYEDFCAVHYTHGKKKGSAVLHCTVDGNNAEVQVVSTLCFKHPESDLVCNYEFLPFMACDCNGPHECTK